MLCVPLSASNQQLGIPPHQKLSALRDGALASGRQTDDVIAMLSKLDLVMTVAVLPVHIAKVRTL